MRHQNLYYLPSIITIAYALNVFTATYLVAMDSADDCKHPAPHVASTATAAAEVVADKTAASGTSTGAAAAAQSTVAEDRVIRGSMKDALAAINKALATGAYPLGPSSRALTMKVMLERGMLVHTSLSLQDDQLFRFSSAGGHFLKPKIDFLDSHRPKFLEPHGHPKLPKDSHVITLMRLKSGEYIQSHATLTTSDFIGYVRFLEAGDLSPDYKLTVKFPQEPFLFRAIKWKDDKIKVGILEFPIPLSEDDFVSLMGHASRYINILHKQDMISVLDVKLPSESTCFLDSDEDEDKRTATSHAKTTQTKDKFRVTYKIVGKYFPAAKYKKERFYFSVGTTASSSGSRTAVKANPPVAADSKKPKG
jgi:hypothetical protein